MQKSVDDPLIRAIHENPELLTVIKQGYEQVKANEIKKAKGEQVDEEGAEEKN